MSSHQKWRENTPGTKSIPILLVDDDVELCCSLKRLLGMDGFHVEAVHDGEAGVRQALKGHYELVVLDVMLAGGRWPQGTAPHSLQFADSGDYADGPRDEAERIVGLEGGADDYLPKPFNPRELVARMRAVLRRKCASALPEIFKIGDLRIDGTQRKVDRDGAEVP
jgi:DNA-binding response OmpR family regulator